MLDKEQARLAFIEHLASSSTWDDECDELARQFGRAMIDAGMSKSAAIEELQSAGLRSNAATQIVANIIGGMGEPTEPRTCSGWFLCIRFLLSLGLVGLGVSLGFLALGLGLSGMEASLITALICVVAACAGAGGVVGFVMCAIELIFSKTGGTRKLLYRTQAVTMGLAVIIGVIVVIGKQVELRRNKRLNQEWRQVIESSVPVEIVKGKGIRNVSGGSNYDVWRTIIFRSTLADDRLGEVEFVLKDGPVLIVSADELRRVVARGDHYKGEIWRPLYINPGRRTINAQPVKMRIVD